MAIWQFQLVVIPRKGVIEKFGEIPDKLEIDFKERNEHFYLKKEKLLTDEDKFKDALIQDWWSSSELQVMEVVHQIDKLVKRADYSKDTFVQWKYSKNRVDNDAWMSINKESGKIEELIFRTDLREEKLIFLKEMIKMAKDYDWLLMDMKGNLANPVFKEIVELIKISNSYKFAQDPYGFLEELGKKKN